MHLISKLKRASKKSSTLEAKKPSSTCLAGDAHERQETTVDGGHAREEEKTESVSSTEASLSDEVAPPVSAPKIQKFYPTGCGYTTERGRVDWLRAHGVSTRKAETISTSLVANPDPNAPLYYWQLFSLLGFDRIEALIRNFYERVFADHKETWFRDAFRRTGSMDHHIRTQAYFWADSMGGGLYYHGGDGRLNFHHTYNARGVMNAQGAKRWMYHMNKALADQDYSDIDERIKPCIVDFLRTKMMKYANQHSWKIDLTDFNGVKGISRR